MHVRLTHTHTHTHSLSLSLTHTHTHTHSLSLRCVEHAVADPWPRPRAQVRPGAAAHHIRVAAIPALGTVAPSDWPP